MAKRKTKPPVVTSRVKPCPHCGKSEGFRKARGAYLTHVCNATGIQIKFYRSKCKACGCNVIERVEKKLTETAV